MVGRRVRELVIAGTVPRTDAALMRAGHRPGATHRTVAGISVLSQVQARATWVADRTAKSKLLMVMRVLLCGATVLRRFGYSKSRYFALLLGIISAMTDVARNESGAVGRQ